MTTTLLYGFFWIFINLDVMASVVLMFSVIIWFYSTRKHQPAYKPKLWRCISITALFIFGVINLSPLGPWMIMYLENTHSNPTYTDYESVDHDDSYALFKSASLPPASYPLQGMIVLGGSLSLIETKERGEPVYNLAGSRVFSALALARTLKRTHPHMKIILTGNELETSNASKIFLNADFSKDHLILESQSCSTQDHPRLLKPFLKVTHGNTPHYLLVTSAFHMPRSVALFERAGIPVIPYCVDYHAPHRMSVMFWLSMLLQRLNAVAFKQACLEFAGLAQMKFS